MAITECFSIIKDISLSGAAITTAIVAWRGLESWKKELKGKAEFDVARTFIKATYNLRDILDACRNPWIRSHEFPGEYINSTTKSPKERGKGLEYVYWNRWDKVTKYTQEFDAASLEAEALWGEAVEEKAKSLRRCVSQLRAAIEAFIRNEDSDGESFRSDKEFAEIIKSRIYATHPDKNEFTLEIKAAINEIEKYVRPHLSRG